MDQEQPQPQKTIKGLENIDGLEDRIKEYEDTKVRRSQKARLTMIDEKLRAKRLEFGLPAEERSPTEMTKEELDKYYKAREAVVAELHDMNNRELIEGLRKNAARRRVWGKNVPKFSFGVLGGRKDWDKNKDEEPVMGISEMERIVAEDDEKSRIAEEQSKGGLFGRLIRKVFSLGRRDKK